MVFNLSQTAFRIYIPHEDAADFSSITDTLIETASVLPHTEMMLDDVGNRAIVISKSDAQQWPHIVDKVRQLVSQYEKYLDKRESFLNQTEGFSWDDYTDSNGRDNEY